MGPITYMIAILGCTEGSIGCQQVALVPTRYESHASCSAAADAALVASTDLDFPMIVAECRAAKTPAAVRRDTPKHDSQIVSRQG